MGTLNILSYVLAFTAMGQYWFYKHLFPHVPVWIIWGVVFVPWVWAPHIVVILKNRGLFWKVVLTPENPDAFINSIREAATNISHVQLRITES